MLSQTIRGLQVGRLYSVKLLSADYGEPQAGKSSKTVHPMSVLIEGGEIEGTKHQYQEAFPTRARRRVHDREPAVSQPALARLPGHRRHGDAAHLGLARA